MLDLRELERKVDEAIEKDTPSDMMEWLRKKKREEFSAFLAEGNLEPLQADSSIIFVNPVVVGRSVGSELGVGLLRTSALAA
ncbi:MAG: hypothetical protein ABSE63_12345 [Thermoguttaceae bacterium]|jgi:hypothetical protein